MSALKLVMTIAGLGRFTAAQASDDIDLTIASVGLTAAEFVAAPTLTGLPGEFRRLSTVSGSVEAQNIVHLTITDDAPVVYSVTGFGLYLADGTLFAAYSQPVPIVQKSDAAMMALAIDIAFPVAGVEQLTFGSTNFLNPPATTARKGVVELGTEEEVYAGTDPSRVAALDVLRRVVMRWFNDTTASITRRGIVELATDEEAYDGAKDDLVAPVTAARVAFLGWMKDYLGDLRIAGAGLVSGGGTIDEDRELRVDAATPQEIIDGVRADVAVTPAAMRAALNGVFAIEGYRIAPDGFTEMWGVLAGRTSEGSLTLVFPQPFATACLGLHAITINSNQTVDGLSSLQEIALHADRAELFVQNHNSSVSEVGGYRWRAWGY